MSAVAGGVDLAKAARNPPRDREEAKNQLDQMAADLRRSIFDPNQPISVLHRQPLQHRDYSHRVYIHDDFLEHDEFHHAAHKTMPTKDDLDGESKHFYRFGLQVDLEDELQLTKHIQVFRFKNLIEVVVDGPHVQHVEILVLCHFLK